MNTPRAMTTGLPANMLRPGLELASRYRLLGPVGNGGMAWVWEATDLVTGESVAIKHFRSSLQAPLRELADREADLLRSLRHRGIPRLLGTGEHGGSPYLVMEFIPGWDLDEAIQHELGPFARGTWTGLGDFATRLATILAAVHEQGVVHRDINAHNVMIRPTRRRWEPILVDLGLGCMREEDASVWCKRLAGNLRNLAPEQIEQRRCGCETRTDVYQFGLLLYRLLTGREAFAGSDMLVERILAGDFLAPREIDPRIDRDLERIALRCMERDPRRRYDSARELCRDLSSRKAAVGRIVPQRFVSAWRTWSLPTTG